MDKRKRIHWTQDDKKLLRSTSRKISRTPSLADILKDTYAHSKLKVYFSNIVGLRLADVPDHAEVSLSFTIFSQSNNLGEIFRHRIDRLTCNFDIFYPGNRNYLLNNLQVCEQGRMICQEYIFNRLKKQNLLQHAGKAGPVVQAVLKSTDISRYVLICLTCTSDICRPLL